MSTIQRFHCSAPSPSHCPLLPSPKKQSAKAESSPINGTGEKKPSEKAVRYVCVSAAVENESYCGSKETDNKIYQQINYGQ